MPIDRVPWLALWVVHTQFFQAVLRYLLPVATSLLIWSGNLVAQPVPGSGQDILAGRDWKPLTVIDPILDLARQQEVRDLLANAERQYGLRFMVLTIKAQDMRKYPPIAMELMKQKLALDEGGVLICTDDPETQLMAYTKLLELRLGPQKLREIDQLALARIKEAFGPDERAVTMVRVITEEVGKAVQRSSPEGPSSAAEAFVFNRRLVTDLDAPDPPGGISSATNSRLPTHPGVVAATGQAAQTPEITKSPAATETETAPSDSVRLSAPILAGFTIVVLVLASIVGWLVGMGMSRRAARKANSLRGTSGIGPRTTPPAPPSPLPGTNTVEERGGLPIHPVKPRQMESRAGRQNPAAPPSEMPPEWATLSAMADSNRRKSADEYFDARTEFDPHTLREIHLHYRVLFKLVPPVSRPALTESLDRLLELRTAIAPKGPRTPVEH